jgi:hypothetical protein
MAARGREQVKDVSDLCDHASTRSPSLSHDGGDSCEGETEVSLSLCTTPLNQTGISEASFAAIRAELRGFDDTHSDIACQPSCANSDVDRLDQQSAAILPVCLTQKALHRSNALCASREAPDARNATDVDTKGRDSSLVPNATGCGEAFWAARAHEFDVPEALQPDAWNMAGSKAQIQLPKLEHKKRGVELSAPQPKGFFKAKCQVLHSTAEEHELTAEVLSGHTSGVQLATASGKQAAQPISQAQYNVSAPLAQKACHRMRTLCMDTDMLAHPCSEDVAAKVQVKQDMNSENTLRHQPVTASFCARFRNGFNDSGIGGGF